MLAPLTDTLEGVVEGVVVATTVGTFCVVVVFDIGQLAPALLRVLLHDVTVSVDMAVVVVFQAWKVVLLALDEVVMATEDDELDVINELDEDEVDEVVGLGVSDTRLPVTLISAAQAARSVPSGQHVVLPALSAAQ